MGNIQSEFGDTRSPEYLLIQSIATGDVARVQSMLSEKPDLILSALSKHGQNAWHYAAQGGQLEVLRLLHKDPGVAARRALSHSRSGRSWETAAAPVDHQNKKGQTPLMLACQEGHHSCAAFLVDADSADPWVADLAGSCAIHYAALKGHAACLQALLAKPPPHPSGNPKAKYVNVRNQAGLTPLHCAVYAGHTEAARVLLAAGCRLVPQTAVDTLEHEVSCNRGSTPLHLAAMRGHTELVRVLMATYVKIIEDSQEGGQHGIACPDPRSIPDNYGLTPFLIATKWGRENVAAILDPMTPLDITPKSPSKHASSQEAAHHHQLLASSSNHSHESSAPPAPGLSDAPEAAAGTPSTVSIAVSAGPAAAPGSIGGGGGGGTTAWMEEILNRVVPESQHTISLPPRGGQDASTGDADEGVPSDYLCPISLKLMSDPVIAADGCTYDNKSLDAWVAGGAQTYPNSTCAVDGNMKLPNTLLRAQINQWRRQNPELAAAHS